MAAIAWWNNHKFEISPSVIRGFTDLQIKGSGETEEKTGGGEKYVSWKNTKPTEVTLTAHLNAYFGCDVRNEATRFILESRWGESGYLYAYYNNQWSKLLLYKMMLTDALITKVDMAPTGKWVSADVQLTLKSCRVSDDNTDYWGSKSGSSVGGSSYSGSGGYSKATVRTSSETSGASSLLAKKVKNGNLTQIQGKQAKQKILAKQAASIANKEVSRITSAAKKTTMDKKKNQSSGYGKYLITAR